MDTNVLPIEREKERRALAEDDVYIIGDQLPNTETIRQESPSY
jgi:hypothetical protein